MRVRIPPMPSAYNIKEAAQGPKARYAHFTMRLQNGKAAQLKKCIQGYGYKNKIIFQTRKNIVK